MCQEPFTGKVTEPYNITTLSILPANIHKCSWPWHLTTHNKVHHHSFPVDEASGGAAMGVKKIRGVYPMLIEPTSTHRLSAWLAGQKLKTTMYRALWWASSANPT